MNQTNGFIERNASSLVIVADWSDFVAWAKEAGYGESALDVNDSCCLELQRTYLDEQNS